MSAVQQIVLVGLSGSGKSTVGRELSERLGWTLIDTDDVIEERAGQTPAELITADGERKFRDLESAVIEEVVKRTPSVIATTKDTPESAASRIASAANAGGT